MQSSRRLWVSKVEISNLKRQMAKFHELSRHKEELLDSLRGKMEQMAKKRVFYNVRSRSSADVPPLRGTPLTEDMKRRIIPFKDNTGNVVATLDMIETGEVRGWACVQHSTHSMASPVTILVYVDERLIGKHEASVPVKLPSSALKICLGKDDLMNETVENLPVGFTISLPPLAEGTHEIRVFATVPQDGANATFIEVLHSPATFVESVIDPDLQEVVKRKDSIIVRRNAELVELWNEVKNEIPWKKAEAALKNTNAKSDAFHHAEAHRSLVVLIIKTVSSVEIENCMYVRSDSSALLMHKPISSLVNSDLDRSECTQSTMNKEKLMFILKELTQGSSKVGSRSCNDIAQSPESIQLRNIIRQVWSDNDAITYSEGGFDELKLSVRFVMSTPSNLKRKEIDDEMQRNKDIIIVDENSSANHHPVKLALAGLAKAIDSGLDAKFYVITHDKIAVNVEAISLFFEDKVMISNGYFGCQKSGPVIGDEKSRWHEPEEWRFGDRERGSLQYPRHAAGEFYAISRNIARYLSRNRSILHAYAFEDTSVGAWMLGLEVEHIHDQRFCCSMDNKCTLAPGTPCLASYDNACNGMCNAESSLEGAMKSCNGVS